MENVAAVQTKGYWLLLTTVFLCVILLCSSTHAFTFSNQSRSPTVVVTKGNSRSRKSCEKYRSTFFPRQYLKSSIQEEEEAKEMMKYNTWAEESSIESFNMDLTEMTLAYDMDLDDYSSNNNINDDGDDMDDHHEFVDHLQRAQDVLEIGEELYTKKQSSVRPNSASFNIVMNGWAYHCKTSNQQRIAGESAQALLDKMILLEHIQPNVLSYLTCATAWALQARKTAKSHFRLSRCISAATNAQNILFEIKELYKKGNSSMKWEMKTCLDVLFAWRSVAKRGYNHAAENAEVLLNEMEKAADERLLDERPDRICYTTALKVYESTTGKQHSRSSPSSVQRAENLVKRMEQSNREDLKPDAVTYTSLINVYARSSCCKDGARKAEDLLNRMEEMYLASGDASVEPTVVTYTSVISAYALQGGDEGAIKAEAILRRMLDLYEGGGRDSLKPTNICYNAVIGAHANSGNPNAGQRAEAILDALEERVSSSLSCCDYGDGANSSTLAPNVRTFTEVMHAWSRSKGRNIGQKADILLKRMMSNGIQPNVISYTLAIKAYGDDGKPEMAEQVFRQMLESYGDGNGQARPNIRTYQALIDAWAKRANRAAAQHAFAILCEMERTYENSDSGNNIFPVASCYNSVMNCWVQSNEEDAASQVELIFKRLETFANLHDDLHIEADTTIYNTRINACSKSRDASKALKFLKEMNRREIPVDTVTFNTVLSALSKQGNTIPDLGPKANDLLTKIEELSKESHLIRPTAYTYNTVINCWARCKSHNKATESLKILQRMVHLYKTKENIKARPDIYSYTTVINACAFTQGSDPKNLSESLVIALSVFKAAENDKRVTPNAMTYSSLIKAYNRLMSIGDQRDKEVLYYFKKAQDAGMITPQLLQILKLTLSKNLYQSEIQDHLVNNNIPLKWKRSVSSSFNQL